MSALPKLAIIGNVKPEDKDTVSELLKDDELSDLCSVTTYYTTAETEQDALRQVIKDYEAGKLQGVLYYGTPDVYVPALNNIFKEKNIDETCITMNGDIRVMPVFSMTSAEIVSSCKKMSQILKRDFSIQNPRMVILQDNRHQENDSKEKSDEIASAISELANESIQAFGPLSYSTFLSQGNSTCYDGVLQSREDYKKGKACNQDKNYNITYITKAGLPLVCTTVNGLLRAIYCLIDITRNSKEYQKPFENPLQKLYHERKESGDKTRFTVKKKGFNPAEHKHENVTYITKNDTPESVNLGKKA